MESKKKGGSSIRSVFMHGDGVDKILMAFGLFGSIGDGCTTPLVLLITSRLMNNVGGGASSNAQDAFLHNINKVYHSLAIISIDEYDIHDTCILFVVDLWINYYFFVL